MPAKIIGLTGFKEVGKDSVGALLHMLGYQRLAFGDILRIEVFNEAMFSPQGEIPVCKHHSWSLEARNGFKAVWRGQLSLWEKPYTPLIRKLLQEWGSEFRRGEDENYWVIEAQKSINQAFTDGEKVVLTDVRFLNEAALVNDLGGQMWRVTRPEHEGDGHISETEQTEIAVSKLICNDGDFHALAERVLEAYVED